jgi:hypothetical protein
MRSPALAIGWQLWLRHRWALSAVFVCWLALAVLCRLPVAADLGPGILFALALPPVSASMVYPLVIFTYSLETANFDARESGFPARMFTLPLRTPALVGWPMLYGAGVAALLWLAWAYGVFRPVGISVARAWLAVLFAACMAWLQALAWCPFAVPWLRVAVVLTVMAVVVIAPPVAVEHGAPVGVVAGLLALSLPAAYGVAVAGVGRARRGDLPGAGWFPRLAALVTAARQRPGRAFASAVRAQAWLEWRQRGLAYPILLGVFLLPCAFGFLGVIEQFVTDLASSGLSPAHAAAVRTISAPGVVLAVLLLPPLYVAWMMAGEMGKMNLGNKAPAIASLLATRPLSSGDLVLAKFRMAVRSTLAGWALLLAVSGAWLVLGGKVPRLAGSALVGQVGPVRAGLFALLAVLALVLLTWLQMIKGMWVGLAGRGWVLRGNMLAVVAIGTAVVVAGLWLSRHPEYGPGLEAALPWALGGLVAAKLLTAAALVRAVRRRGLWPPAAVAGLVVGWLAAAAFLAAVPYSLLPPEHVPARYVLLSAALLVPLVRVAAAPLALDFNRHR